MCGIAGFYSSNYKHEERKIHDALKSIAHRGPDGHGVDICDMGFMAHSRLSILDPGVGGVQPFVKHNGLLVTAHNGEIYNHQELRDNLLGSFPFDGYSDGEIIPYLYEELGIDGLCTRLEGMFAFVVLDKKERFLYLCRDTFGIKPLYYRSINGGIAFGSEIKALLAMDPCIDGIRHQAIMDFLSLGYIPEPDTIYADIYAVPRGSYLKFSLDSCEFEIQSFVVSKKLYPGCTSDELDSLLQEVITQQSVADFPVGALLSGGVDSTLVSTYFAEVKKDTKTFTVSFSSADRDEAAIATATASALGSRHTQLNIESVLEWDLFHGLMRHFDQPFADLSFLPTYAICEQVRKEVKVVLTGDGGDEFAAGYPKFRHFRFFSVLRFIPRFIRKGLYEGVKWTRLPFRVKKFLKLAASTPEEQLYGLSAIASEDLVRSFLRKEVICSSPRRLYSYDPTLDFSQNVSINQCNTSLVSKMLPKVDRMSMLARVEARVPLLDTRITSCLFSMRPDQKLRGRTGKVVFREILRKRLPGYRNKRKIGFDFDHKEFDRVGWTDRMVLGIRSSCSTNNPLWKILDEEKVSAWLDRKEAGKIRDMSVQSQFQTVVNLYALVDWFADR